LNALTPDANAPTPDGPGAPDWLSWARTLQALAQTGLTYATNPFDRQRYEKLEELALEIFAAHTGETAATLQEWFIVQPGYATPKVDVRGACFRDGRILMVRERSDGRWCLPGGWADVGDRPAEAAEREVREEAGFECTARKVIGVFDANRGGEPFSAFHAYKIIFECEITGGQPQPDHEILEVAFFGRAEIPPLSPNRTTPANLAECFAHLDDPARPTAFD
jgi:8-oxo-dGTP pyrophosphatase MutT (NUDIX family)